jgi:hypothetical protein
VQHFGAQLVLPRATTVRGPLQFEVPNLACLCEIRQLGKHASQHELVALAVVRRTESAPDRVIDKHGTRRSYLIHNVMDCTCDECRNAFCFDDVGDETDGLVAKRSIRHEQR